MFNNCNSCKKSLTCVMNPAKFATDVTPGFSNSSFLTAINLSWNPRWNKSIDFMTLFLENLKDWWTIVILSCLGYSPVDTDKTTSNSDWHQPNTLGQRPQAKWFLEKLIKVDKDWIWFLNSYFQDTLFYCKMQINPVHNKTIITVNWKPLLINCTD